LGYAVAPAKDPLQVDLGKLSQISLSPPENKGAISYLGIAAGKDFTVSQITGDVIIVEIFSMYCPICQREAPKVNEMHQLVEKDSALKGKLKIIGVGTGNTPFEVEVFRNKFDVKFPLVSDENYTLEKAFSEKLRTPTFVVVKKDKSKGLKLIDLHVGSIEDVGKYLREVAATGKRK
jgi:thiol-disulfide isomerase/thioredoxin